MSTIIKNDKPYLAQTVSEDGTLLRLEVIAWSIEDDGNVYPVVLYGNALGVGEPTAVGTTLKNVPHLLVGSAEALSDPAYT